MAEFVAGDVVARIRADISSFIQSITAAQQRLQQFAQTAAQIRQAQAAAQQSTRDLAQSSQALTDALTSQRSAHTQYHTVLGQTRQSLQEFLATQRAILPQFQVMTAGLQEGQTSQAAYQQRLAETRSALAALASGSQTTGAAITQLGQTMTQQATAHQALRTTLQQTQQAQEQVRSSADQLSATQQRASQSTQAQAQATRQTVQQLSALPYNAITTATTTFDRAIQQAGNTQTRYRQAIAQAQEALRQFGVTTTASGEMLDRFGQRLSRGNAEALRAFQTGVREAQADLQQLERFGINQGAATQGGGLLQRVLGVAAGVGIATTLTAVVSQIKQVTTESVTLSARMQDLALSFTAIDGSAKAANTTLAFLFSTAQRVGVDFTTVADAFRRLDAAARTTSLAGEGVRHAFEGILSGARVLGVSSTQVSNAIVALEQILTKGRLSAEEYRRQLGNAIPNALQLMAQGLGVTTRALEDMIAQGVVPAELAVVAFGDAMRRLGEQAGPAVDRVSSTFARLKNEMTAWFTALGDAINTQLDPFLKGLISISEKLREIFGIRAPGQQAQAVPAVTPMPGSTPQALAALIDQAAARELLDPGLLARLVQRESRFNPAAVSPRGAVGLGQLLPSTAQALEPGITTEQLKEPERNLRLAARYLRQQLQAFSGYTDQVSLALAAYNAGLGAVLDAIKATPGAQAAGKGISFAQIQGNLPRETQAYVEAITTPPAWTTAGPGTATPVPGTIVTAPPAMQVLGMPEGGPPQGLSDAGIAAVLKTVNETLQTLPRLREQFQQLNQSGLNFGGVLNQVFVEQANQALTKYRQLAQMLAQFPEAMARMSPAQREVLDLAAQQVTVFQQEILDEAQLESTARKRVEALRDAEQAQERLTNQARQQLPTLEALVERLQTFRRQPLEDAAAQARSQVEQAGAQLRAAGEKALETLRQEPLILTLNPQLATNIQEELGRLDEAIRAQGQRAFDEATQQADNQLITFQATLARARTFLGKAQEDSALEAKAAVIQQGVEIRAALERELGTLQQSALLQRRAPALPREIQATLQGFDAQVALQAQAAYATKLDELHEKILRARDTVAQLGERLGAAGFGPAETAIAKINLEFESFGRTLEQTRRALLALWEAATPAQQTGITEQLTTIDRLLTGLDAARQKALEAQRTAGGTRMLGDVTASLEATQRRPPLAALLQQETTFEFERKLARARQTGMDPEQEQQIRAIQAQIRETETLNRVTDALGQISTGVTDALVHGLTQAITSAGNLGKAFQQMGKTILDTVARITLDTGFRMLISLGLEAIGGALLGGAGALGGSTALGGATGGTTGATFLSGTVGMQTGGAVDRPTYAVLGENPHENPEVIFNRTQLAALFDPARTRGLDAVLRPDQLTAIRQIVPEAGREPAMRPQPLPLPRISLPRGLPTQMAVPQAPALPRDERQTAALARLADAIQAAMLRLPVREQPMRTTLPVPALLHPLRMAEGGVVRQPTIAMLGESVSTRPEYVLNSRQMETVVQTALRSATASGQDSTRQRVQPVSVIVVDNRAQAEMAAARERSLGRQVVVQSVLDDLSQGTGSRIGRAMRMSQ
jgi:tape measure domain-containing protein